MLPRAAHPDRVWLWESDVSLVLCARTMDRHIAVSEREIKRGMWLAAEHDRWLFEGAAGVASVELVRIADELECPKVIIVLCGQSITSPKSVAALLSAMAGA
ncbi:MAG: hypothetical protein INR62_01680 [Rhodospirillales bacterium]|nr:hypothetical protein [Acetobacter sp.]